MRNLEIDRLRAMAVIMAVCAHFDFITRGQVRIPHLLRFTQGYEGVILFFAISGYVISKTLIPVINAYPAISTLQSFWIKRITRIMPMAFLWLLIPLLATCYFNASHTFGELVPNLKGALAACLNVFNVYSVYDQGKSIFGVYWSLSLEEQFYLFFPLFLLCFKDWKHRVIGLIILSLLPNLINSYLRGGFRCEAIFYGAILYLLTSKYGAGQYNPSKQIKYLLSGFLVLLLCVIPPLLSPRLPVYIYEPLPALVSAFLVWLAAKEQGFIFPCGRLAGLFDWIGTRSYGIYLIHIPAFNFAYEILFTFHKQDHVLARSALCLVLLIVLTELCYRYVETPIRNWGRSVRVPQLSALPVEHSH